MAEILDFDKFPRNLRFYGGASGPKYGITIDGEDYILKFPQNIKNLRLEFATSYSLNAFSEYIGSHFYEFMGLPVHKTVLGVSGKHIAVACKDFCEDDFSLYEFSKIANAYMGQYELLSPSKISSDKGLILSDVLSVIDGVPHLADIQQALKERFWDMFIIDSLIANPDRNNGNWGILIPVKDRRIESATLAPVFDNGNSLNAKLTEEAIKKYFTKSDKERIEASLKTASIFQTLDSKGNLHKINPYTYCAKHKNLDCDAALLRLKDRIPIAIEKISHLIDKTPLLSQSRKDFYKETIEYRYVYGLSLAFDGLSGHGGSILEPRKTTSLKKQKNEFYR